MGGEHIQAVQGVHAASWRGSLRLRLVGGGEGHRNNAHQRAGEEQATHCPFQN